MGIRSQAITSPRTQPEMEFRFAAPPSRWRTCLLAILMGLAGTAVARSESAQPTSLSIASTRVGIAGLYHVGAWTPLEVRLQGLSDTPLQLEIEAPDPDDNIVLYRSEPQKLESPAQSLSLIFKTGKIQFDLVCRVKDSQGNVVAEKKFRAGEAAGEIPAALPYSTSIWIGVGQPAGFEKPVTEQLGEHLVARAAVADVTELPSDWMAYQSVDALIVAANGPCPAGRSVLQAFEAEPRRAESLGRWVASGGMMLLSVGSNSEGFKTGPLGKWSPILPENETSVRQFGTLQAFGGKPVRFDGTIPMTSVEADQRRIVVKGATTPFVIEVPARFGRLFFCTLDLDRDPFLKWDGLSRFYLQILTRGVSQPDQLGNTTPTNRLSHGGTSDLSTQFTRGASTIEGVQRTSISGNLLYLFIYVLVIGPLDYLIVCRWLKRPEWTWITLPLLIASLGGLGLLAARSTNGQTSRTQTVSIVDLDADSGEVRARNWITLYGSETRRVAVEVKPAGFSDSTTTPSRLGWWGIPESSIGGLYRSQGLQFGRREYVFGPAPDRLDRTPLQIWSTRSLESEWSGHARPMVVSKLESTGVGNLQGSLTWTLSKPLQECMLVYGNRVYFPKAKRGQDDASQLAPNYVWEPAVSAQTTQREFRGFLTKLQTRTVYKKAGALGDASKELETVAAVYDSGSRNLNDILPILCFHEYAGGSNYTLLQNDVLDQLDWSHLLRLGDAVLFGRLDQPAVEIALDGRAAPADENHRYTTYVRCLLPVARAQGREGSDFVAPLQRLTE